MDITESLKGLHICLLIGGLSQHLVERKSGKIYRSRLLEAYAICTFFVSLAFLFYDIFGGNEFFPNTNNDIGQTVDYIQMIGIRVSHIVTILEAFLQRSGPQKFVKDVREIDRIFERSLNVDVDNRLLRRKVISRGLIMISVYIGTELLILITNLFILDHHFSIYWLLYLLPFFICGIRYFQIFVSIMIVRQRLDKLSQTLNELNLSNTKPKQKMNEETKRNIKFITQPLTVYETSEYLKPQFDMENADMKRLLIIRDLYNRLWEVTATINRDFGVSILTYLGYDFICIISNGYWIFLNVKSYSGALENFTQIAGSAIRSAQQLFNVLMLALLCEKTMQKTTAIALGLHRIETNTWNDNHNTAIEQFSLQLLHQKLTFSAAGFFDINCTLLYTIVGATTTYLIILIQFHMNGEKLNTS